jgi:hypothetical protein
LLFQSDGALVRSLPHGRVEFDRLSELLVTTSQRPASEDRGIVNLSTGEVTWLGKATNAVVVYE